MPPRLLAAGILGTLAAGGALIAAGASAAADAVWAAGTALALVPLTLSVARTLSCGRAGVDVIALLAMGGALALGEYLAGAVVALMLAGGNALEDAASRRARRDLSALLERAPRIAHRRVDGALVEVPVDALQPGRRCHGAPG
jgi:cation transport ATPase